MIKLSLRTEPAGIDTWCKRQYIILQSAVTHDAPTCCMKEVNKLPPPANVVGSDWTLTTKSRKVRLQMALSEFEWYQFVQK